MLTVLPLRHNGLIRLGQPVGFSYASIIGLA